MPAREESDPRGLIQPYATSGAAPEKAPFLFVYRFRALGKARPMEREQTGEIASDDIDKDAMRRTDERMHRERAEKDAVESEASRSDLGAGE